MPKKPDPVGVPKLAASTYERELRRKVVNPMLRRLRADLEALLERGLVTADEVIERIAAVTRTALPAAALYASDAATAQVARTAKWHKRRFEATMRAAGIDLAVGATEDAVTAALRVRVADNVRLIKTIPARMHVSLTRRIQTQAGSGWRFDPEFLERTLRAEYQSTGWNLKRLTRDQTTKQLGQMTQIRLTQAGFERYTWVTGGTGDNRRPEHQANNGKVFPLGVPPPTGHPGEAILCMCQAVAYVEDADIDAGIASFSAV